MQPRRLSRPASSLAALLLTAACSDAPTRSGPRLELSAAEVTMYRNATFKLSAAVRGVSPLPAVEWASLDPSVATVDDTGLVHAAVPGNARITATAGAVADTALVTVRDDLVWPTVSEAAVSPAAETIDVGGGDVTVTVTVRARDAESGVRSVRWLIGPPGGGSAVCAAEAPSSGTAADGVWQCAFVLNQYAEPGEYIIGYPEATDVSGNSSFPLAPRSGSKTVTGSLADGVAPVVTALGWSPSSVDVREDSATAEFRATVQDVGAGPFQMVVAWDDQRGRASALCIDPDIYPPRLGSRVLQAAHGTLVHRCRYTFYAGRPSDTWTILYIRLRDLRGNERTLTTADLAAAGFPTTIQITGQ